MNEKIYRGFWEQLPKPFFALAPMYDVTDAAFRRIIAKYGKPDVFYTEFASTDGLMSDGYDKLINHLWFDQSERPVIAQMFGTKPEKFLQSAQLVTKLGFDGFDINMGCPDKNIIKGGSCAGLFHTPQLAKEIILASKEGCKKPDGNPAIPVSIKIRIGDTKIDWENWIGTLLEAQPAAIAIHLRTRKEMSKVDAHWEEMPKIVKFVKENTTPENRPLIIGNGDINNLRQAKEKAEQANCDGAMLGRAIFGNPWLFTNKENFREENSNHALSNNNTLIKNNINNKPDLDDDNLIQINNDKNTIFEVSRDQKIKVLLEHVQLYDELFNGVKPFDIMKRHFKAYINGFDGAAELRAELYECKNAEEAETVILKHTK